MNQSDTIPSDTNVNFPPTEDNPLGGLYVVYDDTLLDAKLPTLYDLAAMLKTLIIHAKTIDDIRKAFDAFDSTALAEILNYINSPILDLFFKYRKESTFRHLAQTAEAANNLEALKYLFKFGYIDIKISSNELVYQSAFNGHLEILKFLVESGANIQSDMKNIFHGVSERGHLETLKYLVLLNGKFKEYCEWAFHLAATNGHLETTKYLVELGAHVSAEDNETLKATVQNGHLEVVKYLVSQGADVRAGDDWSLQKAAHHGDLPMVKYLIEQGADIRANDNQAIKNALDYSRIEVLKYLVSLL